jgi:heme exporter protein A
VIQSEAGQPSALPLQRTPPERPAGLQEASRTGLRLVADDLAIVRNGRTIFSGLSFSLASGELLAVRGPNGAGKSTLLRIAAGLLAPTGGHVALEPKSENELPAAHYVGHLDGLKPSLTAAANLHFWRRLWSGTGSVSAALDMVGLGALANLHVATFSAGQRRRMALARLAIAPRPVWLLDEPTTALDESGEALLGALIQGHLAGGGMAIVATHRDLPVTATRTLNLGESSGGRV